MGWSGRRDGDARRRRKLPGERTVRVVAEGANAPTLAPHQGTPAAARALGPAAKKSSPGDSGERPEEVGKDQP